jgi:hypothetical protein
MIRQVKEIIIVNVVLILWFVFVNFTVWSAYDTGNLLVSSWTPLNINITKQLLIGGQSLPTNVLSVVNWVFITFFLSTASNLYYIRKLLKSKEIKPNA